MIKKIQNFIEDNTSVDVTHNQVILGLSVIIAFLLLIIFIIFGSGGPKKSSSNNVPSEPDDLSAPMHVSGQK